MKVKYTGSSKLLTVTYPMGVPAFRVKKMYHFKPGEVIELSDLEAKELLEKDKNFCAEEGGEVEAATEEKPVMKRRGRPPKAKAGKEAAEPEEAEG